MCICPPPHSIIAIDVEIMLIVATTFSAHYPSTSSLLDLIQPFCLKCHSELQSIIPKDLSDFEKCGFTNQSIYGHVISQKDNLENSFKVHSGKGGGPAGKHQNILIKSHLCRLLSAPCPLFPSIFCRKQSLF